MNERDYARKQVTQALQDGRMRRGKKCSQCGLPERPIPQRGRARRGWHPRIQAHHDDYTKPLRVRWLCTRCHGNEHRDTPDPAGAVLIAPLMPRAIALRIARAERQGNDVWADALRVLGHLAIEARSNT